MATTYDEAVVYAAAIPYTGATAAVYGVGPGPIGTAALSRPLGSTRPPAPIGVAASAVKPPQGVAVVDPGR